MNGTFSNEKIIYLPLDERPCNYHYPVQLASMTDLVLIVPPLSLLGMKKQPAQYESLRQWLEKEVVDATRLIVSLDLLLYGGIVPSRLHHLTNKECEDRLELLKHLKAINPSLKIYANNLILRVPFDDNDDEEPSYCAQHGRKLYEYKRMLDKGERENLSEFEMNSLTKLTMKIPSNVLTDFTDRRATNAYVNRMAIRYADEGIIDKLVIPLDGNGRDGYSAKEHHELLFMVDKSNLVDRVMLYPGADEIGCTLLAGVFCEIKNYFPEAYVRYSSTQGPFMIPRYEDRSLNESIKSHMTAAGVFMADSSTESDFVLMVNAPPLSQSETNESYQNSQKCSCSYHSEIHLNEFRQALRAYSKKGLFIALADVAVCSGADHKLMKLLSKGNELNLLGAYAAWNTSGNTLGTVIAHAVIASYYSKETPQETIAVWRERSKSFMLRRLIEDWGYQTVVRSEVIAEVLPELDVTPMDLGSRGDELRGVIKEGLNEFCSTYLMGMTGGKPQVADVKLPWHRMFEVDFTLVGDESVQAGTNDLDGALA
ncbi:DUF4127 family protein [Paenibacillus sp. HGF5]|uniref:DUF4127 family protein n=1 Tax=Paenibacillus sp. HGF5 TaxID=908341 RepID=UPI0002071D8B|nr:DUF4127 family protein [Paenibacillus sp. HGF5]EGG32824.1 hypothetical protein HMPREF9412_1698 [Paenibacillus sp. HGF5]